MASNNQPPKTMMDPVVVLGCVLLVWVMVYILWSAFHTQIATAYAWLRMAQFFVFWSVGEVVSWLSTPFHDWFNFFWKSDKSLIQWAHLADSSLYANIFTLFFIVVPFSVWMAKKSTRTNPYNHKHFGRVKDHTLHTFTDMMGAHYPHLRLFRKLNLTKRSINTGKYRMADTEKRFVIDHHLLDRVKEKSNDFKVNRDRSLEVFRAQLGKLWVSDPGKPWTGYARLSRSEFALVAALIPRIAATDEKMPDEEYKAALKLTDKLIATYWRSAADSYESETDSITLDLELAKSAVKKYGRNPKVLGMIRAHAYVSTIIYALLMEARTLGVLAACDLRWLRVTDRRTWLYVNNVGRIVSFAECGGVYSHYLHEQRQKRAVERPQVDAAVKGLVDAVEGFKFMDSEIEEINAQLAEKEAKESPKPAIDMEAVAQNRKTIVLATATLGGGEALQVFGAAILAENGDPVFHGFAKPAGEIDEETSRAFALDDSARSALSRAPEAEKFREQVLAQCNGHRVVIFDETAVRVFPGLPRSAGELVICAPLIGHQGGTVYDAAALMQLGVAKPGTRDLGAEAKACRDIWMEIQKRLLLEQQKNAGAKQ